jgi:uncharacterized protein with von Willebrand factor type A (vWA) domain
MEIIREKTYAYRDEMFHMHNFDALYDKFVMPELNEDEINDPKVKSTIESITYICNDKFIGKEMSDTIYKGEEDLVEFFDALDTDAYPAGRDAVDKAYIIYRHHQMMNQQNPEDPTPGDGKCEPGQGDGKPKKGMAPADLAAAMNEGVPELKAMMENQLASGEVTGDKPKDKKSGGINASKEDNAVKFMTEVAKYGLHKFNLDFKALAWVKKYDNKFAVQKTEKWENNPTSKTQRLEMIDGLSDIANIDAKYHKMPRAYRNKLLMDRAIPIRKNGHYQQKQTVMYVMQDVSGSNCNLPLIREHYLSFALARFDEVIKGNGIVYYSFIGSSILKTYCVKDVASAQIAIAAIKRFQYNGGTNLDRVLDSAVKSISTNEYLDTETKHLVYGHPHIILLTDGQDYVEFDAKRATFKTGTQTHQLAVSACVFGYNDNTDLMKVTKDTGGLYLFKKIGDY